MMLTEKVKSTLKDAAKKLTKLFSPIVHLVEETYNTGVVVLPDELEDFLPYWHQMNFSLNGQ
jgi:hypothetical protein